MIPYGRQDINSADLEAVDEVLRSDWLTQGPMVPRFEESLINFTGAEYAVAVNSSTSALHISCLALGVGSGDIVWTSPNTFVASANAALYCGAKVDFVDIDSNSFNMSVESLEEKLEWAELHNQLPKVVIPVHFAGQSCNMAAINALSKKYGFSIIEDASHAIGGAYFDELIGSCKYSDITVFSFHPVKIITTGEGGVSLTNDMQLAKSMQQYRTHGITNDDKFMLPRPNDEIWNYQQITLGFNYRMTDIQAALGISQLDRLNDFVLKRNEIAHLYNTALSEFPIIPQSQISEVFSSFHLYPILIRESECGKNQQQIYYQMRRSGIAVNLHYIPVYRQPYFESLGFKLGYCKNAEQYYKETISLPMYPSLSSSDQDKVINILKAGLNL
ncbi:UDP-4-amino-4,6-dideoxy-N-acetyl-beta-L-altrosamine transaminase [Candidatus Pseudothioglobus singularis]|jgi:UDP-4-amino-4,6-dideoxy-N-acetyl-beta-L-altrosamine transaminase|nr:UDP-4-amino-4,6-dideoxy-N-acetyl-beta-L-altrosamine transaminase [Candidatus Pseudothioglobus singularis]